MDRVLVVDDSALVRQVLTAEISKDPELEVVGAAPDPYVARQMIAELRPDVITLDIEMPRMDGLTFLTKLMQHHPLPVVIISSLSEHGSRTALEAVSRGAVEVIHKPVSSYSVGNAIESVVGAVKTAARAKVQPIIPPAAPPKLADTSKATRLIAIGGSTGATQVIERMLVNFPADSPPILIAQHMPPTFTGHFAKRLDTICQMHVVEAQDGDPLERGKVLIAPGSHHMLLRGSADQHYVLLSDGNKVNGHRPSMDELFRSVAKHSGPHAVGAILTGMGCDGAQGMLEMRAAGATTFAQDADSCVVFGMPKEAIKLGAAQEVLPICQMSDALMQASANASNKQLAVTH